MMIPREIDLTEDDAREAAKDRLRLSLECKCVSWVPLRRYLGHWLCKLCGMLRYS